MYTEIPQRDYFGSSKHLSPKFGQSPPFMVQKHIPPYLGEDTPKFLALNS